jgi:hypothetical protein
MKATLVPVSFSVAISTSRQISARKTRTRADVAMGMNNGFGRSHARYTCLNIHNASLCHPYMRGYASVTVHARAHMLAARCHRYAACIPLASARA